MRNLIKYAIKSLLALTLLWGASGLGGCRTSRVNTEKEVYRRAQRNLEVRNFGAAEIDFTLVLELNEKLERAYYYRGISRIELKKYRAAIDDFSQALALKPNDSDTYFRRGLTYLRIEEHLLALKDFSAALVESPKDERLYYARATSKMGLEDFRGAIADYDQAIRFSKGRNLQFFRNRAEAFIRLRVFPAALADFNYVISREPRNPQNYLARASVRLRAGDREGACLDWSRAGEMGASEAYSYINEYCN